MDSESQTTETATQTDGSTNEGGSLLTQGTEQTEGEQQEQKQEETKTEEGAPESYDFTLPEGSDAALPVIEEFKPLAKELGLTNEKAQKLVDFYTETVSAAKEQQWKDIRSGWIETAKQDKEFGGQKFDESVAMAQRAVQQFGTPELNKVLNDYGLGDHPEVIRMMVRVGHAMSEDKIVSGAGSVAERDPAKIMFPSMK